MQRVAIVDPSESSRESLRTLLLGVDFVWLEAECARYEYFFDVIQQQESMPDLAIVNIGMIECRPSVRTSLLLLPFQAISAVGGVPGLICSIMGPL